MSPSPNPPSRTASPDEPAQRQRPYPTLRLNPAMACDTAFRVLARRHLGDLAGNHEATCGGDPTALHQMRIALTRLRTAILFFSPMIDDPRRTQIRDELKWLNAHLGAVRDLDVAIERLRTVDKQRPRAVLYYLPLNIKRANSQRLLARALRSAKYLRLVKTISGWIDNGPWSIKPRTQAASERATPIATYSERKLTQWREELLKKCHKLPDLGAKKRHRLRLLNKKLTYS